MLRRNLLTAMTVLQKMQYRANEKTVKKVLELLTLQKKMETAMTADVDTNVSDEEAAQKKMTVCAVLYKDNGQ